jgi:ABC-type transport system substrate-binding protein
MKKVQVLFIIVLAIILLISACGTKTVTTTTAATTAPVTTTAAPVTTSKAPTTSTTAVTTAPPATQTTAPTTSATTVATVQPVSGGTFTFLHNAGLPTLGSIAEAANAITLRSTLPVFETLLRIDPTGKLIPWLADSWTISADGKTVTFKLHPGIKFSDGTVFDAAAVKYNLEAALKGGVRGSAVLKKITLYEIIDPLTLKLTLSQYDATLLQRLGSTAIGQMGSPTAMAKATTPENQAKDHMVGTGPFLFDSWQRDNFVKFKKNPNYWKPGQPYLDFVVLKNVADVTVSEMAYRAGEAQALENIDPVQAKQLAKDGFTVYSPKTAFLHQWMTDGNNSDSPFKDKRIREALEYAVDRETMALGIGMGYYEALYQPALKSSPNYDATLIQRKYDPLKAKQLLADAGFPNGLKTTIVSDVRVRKDTLVAFQTYLKAANFEATLDIADVARGASLPMQGWKGILFPGFPVPDNFLSIAGRFGVATDYISFYRPPDWQEKWNTAVATVDDAARNALYKAMLKTMNVEANVSFYQGDYPLQVLRQDILRGWELHSGGYSDLWYPEQVWLVKK